MVAMIEARTVLPEDRAFTIDDLDLLPDDGNRYELDDGLLVVSPAPIVSHQIVVQRLSVALAATCPPSCQVLPGTGLEMSPFQYRIPDVVVVRLSEIRFEDKTVSKPPLLAIEVASPSTALYDRNRKKDVYQGFGISAYWIVEPDRDRPELTVFELRRGSYQQAAHVTGDEEYRALLPFPVTIAPSRLVTLG